MNLKNGFSLNSAPFGRVFSFSCRRGLRRSLTVPLTDGNAVFKDGATSTVFHPRRLFRTLHFWRT